MRTLEDMLTKRMICQHPFRASVPERTFARVRFNPEDELQWRFREAGARKENMWNAADSIVKTVNSMGRYLLDLESEQQFWQLAARIMPDRSHFSACSLLLTFNVLENKGYPHVEFSEQLGAMNDVAPP